eukprot:gene11365-13434_t
MTRVKLHTRVPVSCPFRAMQWHGTARSESTGADTAGSLDETIGTAKGQVLTTQANFVRVLVNPATLSVQEKRVRLKQIESARMRALEAGQSCSVPDDLDLEAPVEVLCTVRALLKKMKQRVLVGDRVSMTGLDWVDHRGMVEDVAERDSEYPYPAIANVGNVLLVFAIAQPEPEVKALTRFLVAAEAAGLPFTLAFNKSDL